MQRDDRLTIREIAKMAGVSTQTVSRVINGRPDVAPATRSAVQGIIDSVGFRPSDLARSLVHRRSQTIGVIIAGLGYFGVAETLHGITEESDLAGYGLLLKEIANADLSDVAPVVEFMIARRVEGIIYASPQLERNIEIVQSSLPETRPPIVFLKCEPSDRFVTIRIDNYGGALEAVRHLVKLGRRRIGHISGPLGWFEARERRDGWRDGLREAVLATASMTEGDWTATSGAAACHEILRLDPDVDAIFVGNDQMALGVLHVAAQRGIRIPDDLAVVGFDDVSDAAEFSPPLTTVRQPIFELGRLAVRELLLQIHEDGASSKPRAVVLPTELVVRETAPRPSEPPAPCQAPAEAARS